MTAQIKKGFTLIELLIVIAILGVLAVVVLVAINPVQQLERTRDSGRKSTVTQLGHALQAYYTSRGGTYPNPSATWISDLTNAGELSLVPAGIPYGVTGNFGCTTNQQSGPGGWCYNTTSSTFGAIAYTELASNSERSKCPTGNPRAFFVYSTADGRGGLVCSASEPPTGTQSWNPVQ